MLGDPRSHPEQETNRERIVSEAERRYTAAEYLAFERAAPEKHELVDGQIYAMAGASNAHLKITTNIAVALHIALRGRRCDVFIADFRVHLPTLGNYTYPDVSAQCGSVEVVDDGHDDTFLNPSLVIEVLSPSTERYDRTRKFAMYRSLPSLREYVLVAQDRVQVERFIRDDRWRPSAYVERTDVVDLPSIGTVLRLHDVYDGVTLSPPRPRVVREPIADIHAYAARRFRDGCIVGA